MPAENGLRAFLRSRKADFRKISEQTCGAATQEDVQQTVWLITAKIEKRLGISIAKFQTSFYAYPLDTVFKALEVH